MTPADRIAVGLTLLACGFGGAVQDWPMWGSLVGFGLGFLIVGVLRLVGDDRERQRSGEPW